MLWELIIAKFKLVFIDCKCDEYGRLSKICQDNGQCICNKSYTGIKCEQCATGYFRKSIQHECQGGLWLGKYFLSYLFIIFNISECDCSRTGATDNGCDKFGKCNCKERYTGHKCRQCKPGFYGYLLDCIGTHIIFKFHIGVNSN